MRASAQSLSPLRVFALLFTLLFLLHLPLLRLPYYWDEAGYFVPAAHHLLLTGDPIPSDTLSNAHPPLVMAYLALWWKLSGFTPVVTRTAMLLLSALALLGLYRMGKGAASKPAAVAAVLCTALYPVFFAQSSLAHLDMAAAAFTTWAVALHLEGRRPLSIMFSTLAVLSKETCLVTPLSIMAWELVCWKWRSHPRMCRLCLHPVSPRKAATQLLAVVPLALWLAYHWIRTGYVFGNPEYFQYNVLSTLEPLRILMALLIRLWQTVGHMNLYVLTLAALLAMRYPAVEEKGEPRQRIAIEKQMVLGVVTLAHVLLFATLGGATLARYLLPVIPMVMLVGVSTVRRRIRAWQPVIAVVLLGFVIGLFVNPPYRFAPEDNLAYRDFVLMQRRAIAVLNTRFLGKTVLTAWPTSDELRKPYLGYVKEPWRVVAIRDFSAPEVSKAATLRGQYDVVLAFSGKYDPGASLLSWIPGWEDMLVRLFDFHRDVPPQAVASALGGRIVYQAERDRLWVAVIAIEKAENAGALRGPYCLPKPLS